ncbi:MAG TPA: sugar phosphate isomerase/epimerase [Candidatus Dormibacteraeota bacterium]|nr:sugar phosphate isomerase/epimerase [Candidatus Dormibacteraeota bacterium]
MPTATAPAPIDASTAALAACPVGVVPIVWNNADLADLAPFVPVDTVLDEIARLGYAGCQTGVGFPTGPELRAALRGRGLRLAEVYATLPLRADGPGEDALELGRERLAILREAGGEVLVAAGDLAPEREAWAGRASDARAPRLSDDGLRRFAAVVDALAREALAGGQRLAFHPHAGTFVETPDEVQRFAAATDPDATGFCLDVGHYTVGGGDAVAAVRELGDRVTHVHLKDVAREPLVRLRAGETGGFLGALRDRVFTELGSGILDLDGVLRALAWNGYTGWLMIEQDTTWRPPSESAAIGRAVLAYAAGRAG